MSTVSGENISLICMLCIALGVQMIEKDKESLFYDSGEAGPLFRLATLKLECFQYGARGSLLRGRVWRKIPHSFMSAYGSCTINY